MLSSLKTRLNLRIPNANSALDRFTYLSTDRCFTDLKRASGMRVSPVQAVAYLLNGRGESFYLPLLLREHIFQRLYFSMFLQKFV